MYIILIFECLAAAYGLSGGVDLVPYRCLTSALPLAALTLSSGNAARDVT